MTPATLILLIPLAYVGLQWTALQYMERGWQIAAALPLVALAASLAIFVIGIATNASDAAIWLVLGLPVATLYLVLLWPIHWVLARFS